MHIFSTLFTAQTVDKDFRSGEGLEEAARWCAEAGVTKVYIESYRRTFIEQGLLETARDFFENEGFEVDGCVTTVGFPKDALNDGSKVPCFSHTPNFEFMEEIFRRTAAVFDTIMIDDFLFTTCECDECKIAAAGRDIGHFHSDVMHEMSVERILKPSREVNPNCNIIIKYPNWYDKYYSRGYDTMRQTESFDQIWIGNETREPDSKRWGRYPQTMAFYIQDWGMKLDYEKCMGGWYDAYTTLPPTYLEQARNTILGGARESMLFCYRLLHEEQEGMEDIAALRPEQEGLHRLAYLVSGKKPVGVSVPKKPNADTNTEMYIAGMYGMLGIPAVADVDLDNCAKAVILGSQANHYDGVRLYAANMIKAGNPVAFTQGFLDFTGFGAPCGSVVFKPGDDIWNLCSIGQGELDALRGKLLAPYGVEFAGAPPRVALNLFDDDMEIIQNFNDDPVEATLKLDGRNGKARKIALTLSKDKRASMERSGKTYKLTIPPRTLIVLN
jgi:hypothetical protein